MIRKEWKLFFRALRRVSDLVGILLLLAAVLFALRG